MICKNCQVGWVELQVSRCRCMCKSRSKILISDKMYRIRRYQVFWPPIEIFTNVSAHTPSHGTILRYIYLHLNLCLSNVDSGQKQILFCYTVIVFTFLEAIWSSSFFGENMVFISHNIAFHPYWVFIHFGIYGYGKLNLQDMRQPAVFPTPHVGHACHSLNIVLSIRHTHFINKRVYLTW